MKPEALKHLLNLSRHMATTRSLQPLLEYAMDEAIQFVGAERGYLVLVNASGMLEFRVTCSYPLGETISDESIVGEDLISTTILQNVVSSGQPLVIKNAMADPKWKQSKSVLFLQLRSVMCVPLMIHGTCLGAIYVENRSIDNRFDETDLIPLILFADQAAVYIENANLYSGLEQLVEERTQSLQNEITERLRIEEALRQSVAELEVRNKELDAFAHTVAHDLKNQVSLVLGSAELLLMDAETGINENDAHNLINVIARTAYKLNDIIDALLLLAGVHKEKIDLVLLDMGAIVGETLTRLSNVISQTNAEIIMPHTWVDAVGYAPWIEEVWVNYIANACKYGGQPPRIELGSVLRDDGLAYFWTKDNGVGLSPESLPNLFVPFTRLDNSGIKGNGLGLSIVRRIVEKLGGQVGVESQGLGQGSTFFFALPIVSAEN